MYVVTVFLNSLFGICGISNPSNFIFEFSNGAAIMTQSYGPCILLSPDVHI